MPDTTVALLEARLLALDPLTLIIEDDSHLHAGHAGARGGGHYRVDIVAQAFTGKSTVTRHRMVYAAAGDLMRERVHALSIRAWAPGEDV